MKMETVTIEPFKVISILIRTTNEDGRSLQDIAGLWGRFLTGKVLDAIPNKVDNTVYSIYTNYERDHTRPYDTIIGCSVHSLDAVPDGMVGRLFAGGKYVKLNAKGDLSKGLIADQWSKIWDMKLDRSFTADFEVFDDRAGDPSNAELDFFVAVK